MPFHLVFVQNMDLFEAYSDSSLGDILGSMFLLSNETCLLPLAEGMHFWIQQCSPVNFDWPTILQFSCFSIPDNIFPNQQL